MEMDVTLNMKFLNIQEIFAVYQLKVIVSLNVIHF